MDKLEEFVDGFLPPEGAPFLKPVLITFGRALMNSDIWFDYFCDNPTTTFTLLSPEPEDWKYVTTPLR